MQTTVGFIQSLIEKKLRKYLPILILRICKRKPPCREKTRYVYEFEIVSSKKYATYNFFNV
jgi:hypothetical protein